MATDQLSLYQNALLLCGSESLLDLSEDREPKRKLDQVWADGRLVKWCLEQGDWNHAIRTMELEYNPAIAPDFGYQYAFDKPEDWVRTAAISASDRFDPPLTQYDDEAGYWWSSIDKIYVKIVSNDPDYGFDYSKWPESFTAFVEHTLALRVHKRLTQATTDLAELKKDAKRALLDARGKDARNQPAVFPPRGRWASARRGRGFAYDRRGDN